MVARSNARLTPFLRGVIGGLLLAGWSLTEVANEVEKPDGTHPCQQAIAKVAAQIKARGGLMWNGLADSSYAGRPRLTDTALDKAIVKLVFKKRGSAIVNVKYVQKVIKAARKVSARTISRRLGEAGLEWLRRRRKSLVPEAHKVSRLDWAAWVLTRTTATLTRWAFSDGTVFYLGRCATELTHKTRGALGPYVWRKADGSDGLFADCVGPSAYWKAQGMPVKVWGLLVAGVIFIWVLHEGTSMNGEIYAWLIEHKFKTWLRKGLGRKFSKGAFLVQDHERALWRPEPRQAMKDNGITLLEKYPKCSQDLNPIETVWREVRNRLYVTQPSTHNESRDEFIRRLRQAVAWVNSNRANYLMKLSTCQKEWATDVQEAEPPGARTKH